MGTPAVVRVVEREVKVWARLWRGLAFSMFVQPALYLAAMGLGLGGLVDAHTGHISGLTYLEFVTPGLLVASAMQLGAAEAMWPVLAGVKWMRFYHAIAATPIEMRQLYGGYLLWTALRAVMASSAFMIVAVPLGGVPSWWGVLAIPAAALCAVAFAAPISALSATLETDLVFPMIMRLGVMPLFLFSGTFFPISQLPSGLRPLAAASPLWHGVELARAATTGRFDAPGVVAHVAVLVACIALGSFFGVRTHKQRMHG